MQTTATAEVVCHSKYKDHPELITLKLVYPRMIHSEFMTHRVFSRNASSSRAIPVKRMLDGIRKGYAKPIFWGSNKPGMQADTELTGWRLCAAKVIWGTAVRFSCFFSNLLNKVGLHKQHSNRGTEPYQYITVLVTSTNWENFFSLRDHKDAQPEIIELAQVIKKAIKESTPKTLMQGQWHLPFVLDSEFGDVPFQELRKASAARCARVSYLNFDGSKPNIQKDLELYDRLVGTAPIHASPLEHVAVPSWNDNANLYGWKQLRRVVEDNMK